MAREDGLSCNGVHINIKTQYDQMLENPVMPMPDPRHMRCVEWGGKRYPSLDDVLDACNTLLLTAPETNGEACWQAFHHEEERVGLPLTDLAERLGPVAVAGGRDRDERDLDPGPAKRLDGLLGLGQREAATARADAYEHRHTAAPDAAS